MSCSPGCALQAGQRGDQDEDEDSSSSHPKDSPPEPDLKTDVDLEQKARQWFLEGVQHEQDGQLFDAIVKYRRAVHLVPDIEWRTFHFSQANAAAAGLLPSATDSQPKDSRHTEEEEQEASHVDAHQIMKKSTLVCAAYPKGPLCLPQSATKEVHISALPLELLITLLKWVVTSELDLASLENCAQVCRGFYVACRSADLWRPICLRTWCCSPAQIPPCWRQLYLTSPRLRFQGVYVAKMTYLREGERSFQDNEFHRAWHVVQYFRLIRFFPGGRLAMLITADDPFAACKNLSSRYSCSTPGCSFGQFHIQADRVICQVVKEAPQLKVVQPRGAGRRRWQPSLAAFEVPEQQFDFELQLRTKKSSGLTWRSYAVISRFKDHRQQRTDFDVNNTSFPPMRFLPVTTFYADSNLPLR